MNMLESVSSIIQYTIIGTGVLVALKYGYVTLFFVVRKNQITILNASISNYKLRLKTKINQKFGSFKLYGESEVKTNIEKTVEEILQLQFNEATDYEKLVTGISSINETSGLEKIIIGTAQVKELSGEAILAPEMAAFRKSYENVFNFDKDILIFTVEICKLTNQLVDLIEEYNKFAKNERKVKPFTDIPAKIEIPAFFLLEDLAKRYQEEIAVMKSLSGKQQYGSNNKRAG
ncbi:MAG: hypothetical protein K0R29_1320 [Pseudobdellovibrio sp.]|jgi:hypothetical protein|nr:hypothetical protein [Pseudobdellovibrio sp.]